LGARAASLQTPLSAPTEAMAPTLAPPIKAVRLVTPYPRPKAGDTDVPLSDVLKPGKPAVLHLFTG